MKGQVPVVSTIGIIVLISATLFLFFTVLPRVIGTMWKEVALASAEAVSKDLSGLITISAAAPGDVEIHYQPSKEHEYKVDIENKIVVVQIKAEGMEIVERTKGISKIAVDQIISEEGNYFNVTKIKDEYSVEVS